MTSASLLNLLTRLEEAKQSFGPQGGALVKRLLASLARRRFPDADSLLRFHESLLFLRAFPHDDKVLSRVEELLSSFAHRVELLDQSGADMDAFDFIENSGVAGTKITGTFSYAIARWLAMRYPASVSVDWAGYDKKDRLAQTLPRFLPLLYEESLVEANIPYLEYLHAAQGRADKDLHWLLRGFDRLPISEKEKAELYESLELKVEWDIDNSRAARTNLRRTPRKVFYHGEPLIRRSDVSLAREIKAGPIPLKRLSRAQGLMMIDMLREVTTVRYRELYGITHGDPRQVARASVGRGVEIFLWGLPPERRLPLRAYHAGFTLKNGVPINYIEGISLFDRMEIGFNTFYTFRNGESAWIYAQALRFLNQVSGATCFSVDPYQIGFNNEEAIESGAFWFYRKLGFRPTRATLARLAEAEEAKITRLPGYRTPARTLRRLSQGNIVYEVPGSSTGYWDGFQVRNLGLAVQRKTAKPFKGDSAENIRVSTKAVARALGIDTAKLKEPVKCAFENFAPVLALIPDLARWTVAQKREIIQILRAKTGVDESNYLRRLQRHKRLRDAIRELGS